MPLSSPSSSNSNKQKDSHFSSSSCLPEFKHHTAVSCVTQAKKSGAGARPFASFVDHLTSSSSSPLPGLAFPSSSSPSPTFGFGGSIFNSTIPATSLFPSIFNSTCGTGPLFRSSTTTTTLPSSSSSPISNLSSSTALQSSSTAFSTTETTTGETSLEPMVRVPPELPQVQPKRSMSLFEEELLGVFKRIADNMNKQEQSSKPTFEDCEKKLNELGWPQNDSLHEVALAIFCDSNENYRECWMKLSPERCANWVRVIGRSQNML